MGFLEESTCISQMLKKTSKSNTTVITNSQLKTVLIVEL